MEKLNIYIERHEGTHENLYKDVSNIEVSINKLTKLDGRCRPQIVDIGKYAQKSRHHKQG